MPTPIRNFRINDETWQPALKKANSVGVSLTFVVKSILRDFTRRGEVIISAPAEIKMPRSTQLLSQRFAKAARAATKSNKK
ncbi:MAG: hypothetical protein ABIE14_00580 [Patescibacteria group bacterium]